MGLRRRRALVRALDSRYQEKPAFGRMGEFYGARSSVGSSARLWFWMSWVQIPPRAPSFPFHTQQLKALRHSLNSAKAANMATCMPPRHAAKQRGPGGMTSVLPKGADWELWPAGLGRSARDSVHCEDRTVPG